MGSCWVRLPDSDGAGGHDFENEDYGIAGPPDEITVGPHVLDLSDYSFISFRPVRGDEAGGWLVTITVGPDDSPGQSQSMSTDDAIVLLRELRLRARTKPKQPGPQA
jgi:hypothetical protein